MLAENRESTQRLNEFVRKLQAELYSTREEQVRGAGAVLCAEL